MAMRAKQHFIYTSVLVKLRIQTENSNGIDYPQKILRFLIFLTYTENLE